LDVLLRGFSLLVGFSVEGVGGGNKKVKCVHGLLLFELGEVSLAYSLKFIFFNEFFINAVLFLL
jgi:hypothetical protein